MCYWYGMCVCVCPQHKELMKIAAAETKARGAHTVVITDLPKRQVPPQQYQGYQGYQGYSGYNGYLHRATRVIDIINTQSP